jgi:diadenosine tetraphosphate (Ap4A) HIT family hydrolase
MNLYPYNPGHFMIIPLRHLGKYQELTKEEVTHIALLSQWGVEVLERWGAKGINMGWNLGWSGGAGIPDHIHLHLVPRFDRDTNMMTTIFQTRVYSADFEKVYRELRREVEKIKKDFPIL